jgi:membrane-bound metal-dependent hydrolase YbcI (DUF457 family)
MNGNCHFVLGISVATACCIQTDADLTNIVLITSSCLLGSIFPDIDNPASHFGQLTKPISTIIGKTSEAMGKSGSNHRGLFHDIALYGLGLGLSLYYSLALIWFFLGTLSHLLLDSFTCAGVPIMLGQGRFRLAKCKSGDKSSIAITWILALLIPIGVWLYKYHII